MLREIPTAQGEDGFTFVEVITSMAAGIVLLLAIVTLTAIGLNQGTRITDRIGSKDEIDLAFDRMKDDIRQAHSVTPSPTPSAVTSGVLTVRTPVALTAGGVALHEIRWDCTQTDANSSGATRCVREDLTGGGIVSGEEAVLDGIVSPAATTFTVRPLASTDGPGLPSVSISLAKQVEGTDVPVSLTSTVTPRQCPTGLTAGSCPWP